MVAGGHTTEQRHTERGLELKTLAVFLGSNVKMRECGRFKQQPNEPFDIEAVNKLVNSWIFFCSNRHPRKNLHYEKNVKRNAFIVCNRQFKATTTPRAVLKLISTTE